MNEIHLDSFQESIRSRKFVTRYYNIHNLIKLKIMSTRNRLIDFFEKEYSFFRTDEELEPQIELVFSDFKLDKKMNDLMFQGKDYFYNDYFSTSTSIRPKYLILRKRVEELAILGSIIEKKIILISRDDISLEYLQSCILEPLFRIFLNLQGYEFIHSSCVCDGSRGFLFPAWRTTGKTSIVLYLCLNEGFNFISDDWTIISKKGELFAYPRPIQIFEYNIKEYPNLLYKLFRSRLRRFAFKQKVKISSRRIDFGSKLKKIKESCPLDTVIMPIRWSNENIMIQKNVNKLELAQKIVSCANYEHNSFYRHLFSSNFQLKFQHKDLLNLIKSQVEIVSNAIQNSVCHEMYIPRKISFSRIIPDIKELIR